MSYENENNTKTDWLKVSTVMMKFMIMGLIVTIAFAVGIVLNAQYEAVRGDQLPLDQLVIVNVVIWSLFGGVAGYIEQQWLLSDE